MTAAVTAANMLAPLAMLLVGCFGGGTTSPATVILIAGGQAVALANTMLPTFDQATGRPDHSDGRKLLAWAAGHGEDFLERPYGPIVARADRPSRRGR